MHLTSFNQTSVEQIVSLPQLSEESSESSLVPDILSLIFANLNLPSLGCARQACQKWHRILTPNLMNKALMDTVIFGPEDWSKRLKKKLTSEELKAAYAILPSNIVEILKSPCSAFSGKFVKGSHALVYIPKDLTLIALGEILEKHLEAGNRKVKGFSYIWNEALIDLDKPAGEDCWVLMTKDVLGGEKTDDTGSRSKFYAKQQEMVQELAKASGENYEVPKRIEAVAVIIAHFLKSGEYLFNCENLCTYTSSQEDIRGHHMIIGSFTSNGLKMDCANAAQAILGVAGLRKFFRPSAS